MLTFMPITLSCILPLSLMNRQVGMIPGNDAITAMQNCTNDIRSWMEHDKLLLNDDKTEFLIIGTRQQLSKLDIPSIRVGKFVVGR